MPSTPAQTCLSLICLSDHRPLQNSWEKMLTDASCSRSGVGLGRMPAVILKVIYRGHLKGTKRQYRGQMSQIYKTAKTLEIQPVGSTEVCGKV